jgi:purine-binding chemotaxis protein CheW
MARTDGRKKGKKGDDEVPPASARPQPPSSSEPDPNDGGFGAPRWVSSEETLTFPTEPFASSGPPSASEDDRPPGPSGSGHGRIALPSSGLASDILARADTVDIEPRRGHSEPAEPMEPAPVPITTARPQSVALFGAPVRDDRKAAPELTEHLVTFYLADEEYALDVRVVQEIIRLTETTHVPRAPGFIKGVINLRGRIIPVIDLKRKLELGEVEPSRLARIVVVKLRDRLIGLLVDGASQVLKIPVSAIDAAPEEIMDVNITYIRGVAKLDTRLIILLDLYKILAMELENVVGQ